jgi:hypothetical protein
MRQRIAVFAALALGAGLLLTASARAQGSAPARFDQGDNGLWMRRHWLHEGPTAEEIAALAASLRERGIRRIYPFLGPMDAQGWPGWRSKAGHVRYVPARAAAFLAEFHKAAPEIRVIPWTGGNLGQDVHLEDAGQRRAFAEHARALVEMGADGIQLNVEPMPSGTPAYLDLLREVKAALGSRTLSVAAYPPPQPGEKGGETYWELPFLREVCGIAGELAVMAYDTGLTSAPAYEALVTGWTRQLAATLPPPHAKGCEWLMGVPAYDDDKDYHRPDVETVEHNLKGIIAALQQMDIPRGFRGVAVYASFSAGAAKWASYGRLWRGTASFATPGPDPRNAPE